MVGWIVTPSIVIFRVRLWVDVQLWAAPGRDERTERDADNDDALQWVDRLVWGDLLSTGRAQLTYQAWSL